MSPKGAPLSSDRLFTTRVVAGSLAATVFAALVFLVWPGLDMKVASVFALGNDRFAGATPLGNAVRHVFSWLPFLLFAGAVVLYALRRWAGVRIAAPSGAGLLFLALSLALGPGLLVNVILKDHSHRPRPYQVQAFGGDDAYRPFWRFDGQCRRNCSFVSGEGASSFWSVAPALLVPAPWRAMAIAAALAFGGAASLLRIAFGGHFLSDCVFAALFTWLVVLGSWRLVRLLLGRTPADRGPDSG